MNEPSPRFTPIGRHTLSEGVRAAILESVTKGELAPGARLPSERVLSEQFSVARTSVREAVQGLITLGVIEKRGNRSYVADLPAPPPPLADLRKRRVTELFEVRQVVEIPIVRLATCRADAAQRAAITALAERFRGDLPVAEFQRLDQEFHWTIATACGNPTLATFYGSLLESIFASAHVADLVHAHENHGVMLDVMAKAATAHRAIARAIAEHDWAAVVEAAERHLDAVENDLISRMV